MGKLTLAQIESAAAHAKAAGLSDAEIEGVRLFLLGRAAQLDGAHKLAVAIDLMPAAQAETVGEFLTALGEMGKGIMARGASALAEISDDEWEAMLGESPDENSDTAAL